MQPPPPRPDRVPPRAAGGPPRAAAPGSRPAGPAGAGGGARREELSKIRRTVGRRMAESKRDVPHFYMTIEVDMSECVRLKDALKAARPDAPAVNYTHLLIRGVAIALLEHPRINARLAGEDAIHIGIAVALEDGLIVPVLHDCGDKDVYTIAAEARELIERVRTGKPHGDDLSGGTFTISNLGMYPIDEFAAVINQPQSAVLAVGAIKDRAVVRAGEVAVAPTMRLTLSSDHRVIDGAEAAQFSATLLSLLENPVRLILS
jgi:pyruvate dehydrogenase E2 component (dihydrolipoamide acetyltransferase)